MFSADDDLELRPLLEADASAIASWMTAILVVPASPSTFLAEVAQSAQDDFYAVYSNQRLIGLVGLQHFGPPALPQTASLAILLEPESRGRGLGRQILGLLLDRARARGLRRVWLEVLRANAVAIRAYQAAGFRLEEDRGDVLRFAQTL